MTNSHPHEDELVKQAVKGNDQAFASLYDNYLDGIYRFIYIRVEDHQTAEDITSTVFLKAWENLAGYQPRGIPFRAWLFRIARNAVIDHYRTRKQSAPLDAVINVVEDDSQPLSEKIGNRLETDEVLSFMQELTEDQRNVLALKFVQGFSTKEIAKALGKRQGAVRALQMRGLQTLAKLMENHRE
jgi:RNA polymerase sigma-70 factor (ECF subfamily)